jgi:hypothetical protein
MPKEEGDDDDNDYDDVLSLQSAVFKFSPEA